MTRETTVAQQVGKAVHSTIVGVQQIFGPQDARRYRRLLLKAVRRRWFDEQVDSRYDVPLIELRLMKRQDLLGQGSRRLLPASKKMVEVFDRADKKLLILGAPGTGKKEKLLELAHALLKRAEEDCEPMPVVLSLISWSGEYDAQGFFDWLVDEISDKHDGVGTELCKEWLKDRELVLLLDDLDRVEQGSQEASVSAINEFLKKWDPVQIAVCSRTQEYEDLRPPRLRCKDVVELQRLTREQVNAYLADPGLVALRSLLEEDQTLRDLATSPLYLSIMSEVYRAQSVEAVQPLDSVEARRKELWVDYVDCGFERRGDEQRYKRRQVEHWLSWLARKMNEHKQDLFLIERMQPDWLLPSAQRWHTIGSWLATALVFGLPVGLALGLAFAEGKSVSLPFGLAAGLAFGLTLGLLGGLVFFGLVRRLLFGLALGLVAALAVGIAMGLVFGLYRGLVFGGVAAAAGLAFGLLPSQVTVDRRRIRVVERLSWSWPRAVLGLVAGAGSSFLAGAVVGLLAHLASWPRLGLFFGSIVGPTLAVIAGMSGGEIRMEDKEKPNQGVRRSAKSAIRVGLAAALIFGLSGVLVGPMGIHIGAHIWIGGVRDGLALGMMLGPGLGLAFGGITCIQHAVLRLILYLERHIPWNYVQFLEYARDLGFLRRRGGAYEFRHQQLQDYFTLWLWEEMHGRSHR
jgi:MFS family permease